MILGGGLAGSGGRGAEPSARMRSSGCAGGRSSTGLTSNGACSSSDGSIVFTLVLANILHARFDLPGVLFGALILYTVLNTMLPSLLLQAPFDVSPVDDRPPAHPEDRMRAEGSAPRPPEPASPPPRITG